MEGEMPKDPMMLMSFINMKLRDFYPTLDALCDDMDVDRQELENKMAEAGLESICIWNITTRLRFRRLSSEVRCS